MKRKTAHSPSEDAATPNSPVILVRDLTKTYIMGETEVHALRSVSFSVNAGEYIAIIGASGSGKSTLMNMLGLLDRPTSGSYRISGVEAADLSKDRMADLRNHQIGFVFQRFNLLARTSALKQVGLPLFYAGVSGRESAKRAAAALARVGLGDRLDHRPEELSGGQQQRVAVARALVNNPGIVLADEPTGALDSHTGSELLALFDELHAQGITLVVVTHDMGVAARAQRIITLRDGEILEDRANTSLPEQRGTLSAGPLSASIGSDKGAQNSGGAQNGGGAHDDHHAQLPVGAAMPSSAGAGDNHENL